MDLLLDQDAFSRATREMMESCQALERLRGEIENSFSQLRKDWNSDAGRKFFDRFEKDLLNNLADYSKVFEYISRNLKTARDKYEEVFKAADTVANAQF